jgi:hypothetical protein
MQRKLIIHFLSSLCALHTQPILFDDRNNVWGTAQFVRLLTVHVSPPRPPSWREGMCWDAVGMSCRGLLQVISQHLLIVGHWGKPRTTSVRIVSVPAGIQSRTSRIRARSITAAPTCSVCISRLPDFSVGIAAGCMAEIRIPVSYAVDTGTSFPGGKAAGIWSWALTFI